MVICVYLFWVTSKNQKMNKYSEIEKVLNLVKTQIETHSKFKEEYNRQLALDFNIFQFFKVGENKVSEVLAYFLDVNQNHGQGNVFLKEFVNTFYKENVDISQYQNICEKTITENRRIDIYIQLKDITIAVENKLWADDLENQLLDYSNFLEKDSNGNYILLYLTPYGNDPSEKSISKEKKEELINENKLKIVSYCEDILSIINKWLIVCEADNVVYFLREFKKYLETTFLGKNTLNMSNELRAIIKENHNSVKQLVNEYNRMRRENISKLNSIGKKLENKNPKMKYDLRLEKSNLFNYEGERFYKFSVSKGKNKIWVQLFTNDLDLCINYYLHGGTEPIFEKLIEEQKTKISYVFGEETENEIIELFLNEIETVMECFNIYDESKRNTCC